MDYDALFDREENKALIAICTRKLISNIGVGGIVWGAINTVFGIFALQATLINLGLVMLGLLMLGTGIRACVRPTLGVLLTETIVTVLLFLWNLGITILNYLTVGELYPAGLIFPLIIAAVFANYYRKLGHLREHIATAEPEKIKTTRKMCKQILKKKVKTDPALVQTTNRRCRVQLLGDRAFFVQRDLLRAFVVLREDVRDACVKPDAKRLVMRFNHPVSRLTYRFDRNNSEKIKNWLLTGEAKEPA
jgi:hypothetical protein